MNLEPVGVSFLSILGGLCSTGWVGTVVVLEVVFAHLNSKL